MKYVKTRKYILHGELEFCGFFKSPAAIANGDGETPYGLKKLAEWIHIYRKGRFVIEIFEL